MSSINRCEVCGTSKLPGGLSACSQAGDCMICEDCYCSKCGSIDLCERHCHCEEQSSDASEDSE